MKTPSETNWDSSPGLLDAVRRLFWFVLLVTVLGGVTGFGYAEIQDPVYEAEAQILLTDPRAAGIFQEIRPGSGDPARYVRNQARRMTSATVLRRASELLEGRLPPVAIAERVRPEPLPDIDVILIWANDEDPADAVELANAVARAYQDVRLQQMRRTADDAIAELDETAAELRERIRAVEAQLGEPTGTSALQAERDAIASQLVILEQRAQQIAVDASLYGSGVEDFDPASVASLHHPRPERTTAAGLSLGFVLSSALAWWWAIRADDIQDPHAPAGILRAPLLGEVQDFAAAGVSGPVPTANARQSLPTEAYHFIVSSLTYALEGSGGNLVVVTSPAPGDGKTVTALNTAIAASRDDRRVLLVDADSRMEGLAKLCGVELQTGLTRLTSDAVPFEWAVADLFGSSVILVLLGLEVDDPAGFFRSHRFRESLDRIRKRGELVIMDTPPLLVVSETSAIAGQADGVVLVVCRGTSRRVLEEARSRLDLIGTPLLGYVFNRAKPGSTREYEDYAEGGAGETAGKGKMVPRFLASETSR